MILDHCRNLKKSYRKKVKKESQYPSISYSPGGGAIIDILMNGLWKPLVQNSKESMEKGYDTWVKDDLSLSSSISYFVFLSQKYSESPCFSLAACSQGDPWLFSASTIVGRQLFSAR